MILLLDNRDSFTFNLAQVLMEIGAEVVVQSARQLGVPEVRMLAPDGILVGPGPGGPHEAGCSEAVLRELGGTCPILGVCLGHQALATAFGGRVSQSDDLVHGSLRTIEHQGDGVFEGLPSPLAFARYNSLLVEEASLPPELHVHARETSGAVMGLRHVDLQLESVQFHPESILCVDSHGRDLLANFVRRCARS
ncbi:MAG: anthranilate synthase/aminodeoxychorismate synthase-like glutamine amidotransferase [Planctomycetota bacterium]